MRSCRDDSGMATVFTCVCVMALLAMTAMALHFGAAVLARHRVEIAADMGALAGAAVVLQGEQAACDRAAVVVAANNAAVETCVLDGADMLLTVTLAAHLGPFAGTAIGRARAGPTAAQTP